jgi:predicted nuclease of predicted toxin-antitoxin system
MIRFAADEDFDNDILRALRRRLPEVDVVRIQDVGLGGADDPAILAWAAREARVLLTHDVSTMSHHALERVRGGDPMPGVIAVHQRLGIGSVVEDLVLVATWSSVEDWVGQVHYLPLR